MGKTPRKLYDPELGESLVEGRALGFIPIPDSKNARREVERWRKREFGR